MHLVTFTKLLLRFNIILLHLLLRLLTNNTLQYNILILIAIPIIPKPAPIITAALVPSQLARRVRRLPNSLHLHQWVRMAQVHCLVILQLTPLGLLPAPNLNFHI